MSGDRLAWTDDRVASRDRVGTAEYPRTFTATLKDLRPVPVSVPPDQQVERGAYWPAVGDDRVVWSDNQDTPTHPDPGWIHAVMWDEASGAVQIVPTSGAILVGVGGGWLVWYNDHNSPDIIVAGVPLSSLP